MSLILLCDYDYFLCQIENTNYVLFYNFLSSFALESILHAQ